MANLKTENVPQLMGQFIVGDGCLALRGQFLLDEKSMQFHRAILPRLEILVNL